MLNNDKNLKFKKLSKFLWIYVFCRVLMHADVERDFSLYKLIKSYLRNKMDVKTAGI